jgi:hypothetical protein
MRAHLDSVIHEVGLSHIAQLPNDIRGRISPIRCSILSQNPAYYLIIKQTNKKNEVTDDGVTSPTS